MSRAVLLFGHGSRDPAWRRPMDAVADRIAARAPGTAVACAFLELQAPDLPTAVAGLAAGGATSLTVLPMFLGVGKHAREDLPALLEGVRREHPGLEITVMPSAGEHPALIDLLAALALDSTA
jgi:sirohydrochlorin cobaltochelatase